MNERHLSDSCVGAAGDALHDPDHPVGEQCAFPSQLAVTIIGGYEHSACTAVGTHAVVSYFPSANS